MDGITPQNRGQSRRYYSSNGQGLVEFAILIPLLILIVFGVLDLGRAFYALITITNAAREGARLGTVSMNLRDGISVSEEQAMKDAAVNEAVGAGVVISPADVSIDCPSGCARVNPLRVTVTYHFDLVMGVLYPAGLTLSRNIEMLIP